MAITSIMAIINNGVKKIAGNENVNNNNNVACMSA